MTDDDLHEAVRRAAAGERDAAADVVAAVQDQVYRLALRMLGHPADAEDATQEILIVILTHLGTYRGESAFRTWVWRIAANHVRKFRRGRREVLTEEALESILEDGFRPQPLEMPEAEAAVLTREIRLRCTEGMLLTLDRDLRLALILGDIFDLPGEQAAAALDIDAATYRKRLSRARERVYAFIRRRCGLTDPRNPCRCAGQVACAVEEGRIDPKALDFATHPTTGPVDEVEGLLNAAQVIRSHPDYTTPDAVVGGIRELLRSGRLEILRV